MTQVRAGSTYPRANPVCDLTSKATPGPAIDGTVYDTAWLASLMAYPGAGRSQFPECVQWLREQQRADGSWGSSIPYRHDRIINTLAALAALARFGRGVNDRDAIARGTSYLWRYGHLLSSEPIELVGYELLLPELIKRGKAAGVAIPPQLDAYEAQRAEKLRSIPSDRIYSPFTTAAHSLEFLGEAAASDGLLAAQGENGSIGNSPAATAFLLSRNDDPRARAYLERCLTENGGASVPVLYPCETFERLWSAYHLFLAGVPAGLLLDGSERKALRSELRRGGVSLSPSFPIPDADDTAVALYLLGELGDEVDPTVLQGFARPEGHFASFPYERHTSVGVNLHVLHAVLRFPAFPDREKVIDRVLDYLVSQQVGGLYWFDKWHISPYYATAHALRILSELPPTQRRRIAPLLRRTCEWLRYTQTADGAWGFWGDSTAEETAYAVLALTTWSNDSSVGLDWHSCIAADRYLRAALEADERAGAPTFPAMWVDKCLYSPNRIVRSAIVAARIAFQRASGQLVARRLSASPPDKSWRLQ